MPSKSARDRAERAAAQLAEQKRRESRRRWISIGGVVAAMVVIVAVGVLVGQHKGSKSGVNQSDVPAAGTSNYSLAVGDANAPHNVIIYEDFLCPFCREFEAASRTGLAQLAADGKVRIDYRPFHFLQPDYSKEALNAFAVVEKAYPTGDVAKKFHDLLYENQPSEEGPFPSMSKLVDLAVEAGADQSKVRSGIEDTGSMKKWVDGATNEAIDTAGVQSTPTILLDGQYYQKGGNQQEIAANLINDLS